MNASLFASEAAEQTDAEERFDEIEAQHRYRDERARLGEKEDWSFGEEMAKSLVGACVSAVISKPVEDLIVRPALAGAISPWVLPRSILERSLKRGKFLDYPYQDGRSGNMVTYKISEWAENPLMTDGLEANQMWMQTDYSWDSKHSAVNTRFLFEGEKRWGLKGSFDYRNDAEMLADFNGQDSFWIGDLAWTRRFAQSDTMQIRSGLGFMWFSDGVDSDIGWNFLYEANWYLKNPWVVNASVNLGALHFQEGRPSTPVVNFRTTFGYQCKRIQVYLGYQHFQIGDDERDSLISGLQLSF